MTTRPTWEIQGYDDAYDPPVWKPLYFYKGRPSDDPQAEVQNDKKRAHVKSITRSLIAAPDRVLEEREEGLEEFTDFRWIESEETLPKPVGRARPMVRSQEASGGLKRALKGRKKGKSKGSAKGSKR